MIYSIVIEMRKNIKIVALAVLLIALAIVSVAFACGFFHELPINGIGYWTKQKEDSKVVVINVNEHITCNNGMLHLEFDLMNTDGKVKQVELWIYFKDNTPNGGNTLIEKHILVGDMNTNETKHFSLDILFASSSELNKLDHEDFSIHYSR